MNVEIEIPPTEIVPIDKLKTDRQNPNRMTDAQLDALVESIKRFKFIDPIITNKDLLVADGEQRLKAAKRIGMTHVSVIRLPIEDVDRKLLRQIKNKLRGDHDFLLDAREFDCIVSVGNEEDLKRLLVMSDEKLERYLEALKNGEAEKGLELSSAFEVIVECENEKQQEETYTKLVEAGYKCRVLTL